MESSTVVSEEQRVVIEAIAAHLRTNDNDITLVAEEKDVISYPMADFILNVRTDRFIMVYVETLKQLRAFVSMLKQLADANDMVSKAYTMGLDLRNGRSITVVGGKYRTPFVIVFENTKTVLIEKK